jgi:tRNA 2-thiouridine synthesizing protein A
MTPAHVPPHVPPHGPPHDHEWHAGELSCGDLVLELRRRVRQAPGQVFKVIALDAGAPSDLPAWCAMTGHALLAHDPVARAYWIRART